MINVQPSRVRLTMGRSLQRVILAAREDALSTLYLGDLIFEASRECAYCLRGTGAGAYDFDDLRWEALYLWNFEIGGVHRERNGQLLAASLLEAGLLHFVGRSRYRASFYELVDLDLWLAAQLLRLSPEDGAP